METWCAKRAKKGDVSAFEKLISLHEERMYRMAYLYVKNRDDALDAVQEAVYKAFRSIQKLKSPEYVTSWLMRITINCAVDLIRRHGRETASPVEDIESAIPPGEPADMRIIERATLDDLMNVLNADEKRLIMLKYYCDMTFAEIAEETAMPQGSVKTAVYRALGKLRKKAEEEKI